MWSSFLTRLDLLRDRLGLREEAEVVAPARLRVGARHVEAAEGMDADERAGALAVEIQVAARRARACRARGRLAVLRVDAPVSPYSVPLATRDALVEVLDAESPRAPGRRSPPARGGASGLTSATTVGWTKKPVRRARPRRPRRPAFLLARSRCTSRIFFCAPLVDDRRHMCSRVADVADRRAPSSSRRPSRAARRRPSRARSRASRRSTSAPGSRRPAATTPSAAALEVGRLVDEDDVLAAHLERPRA